MFCTLHRLLRKQFTDTKEQRLEMMGKIIFNFLTGNDYIKRHIFSKKWRLVCFVGGSHSNWAFTRRNTCLKVHSAHPPLFGAHSSTFQPSVHEYKPFLWKKDQAFLPGKKNLDEEGFEMLPCLLLGWTTGIRNNGVASCPNRPEKSWRCSLEKLCSGHLDCLCSSREVSVLPTVLKCRS